MKYNYGAPSFIGTTENGVPTPVFYDLHSSVFNNKPPGVLITGAPGSGKTFCAQTLTTISAIMGKTTVVIDPKGDFLPLLNLKAEIGNPVIWNLDRGRPGMLDPFYMSDNKDEQIKLAVEVIGVFTGGLNGDQLGVIAPILRDEAEEDAPSLYNVVDRLKGSNKPTAQSLGHTLDYLRRDKNARLCFAPGSKNRKPISIERGLTIITTTGLNLPGINGAETRQEFLATGILYLLTDFIRRIMQNDDSRNPKTVVIDEAHAIVSTPVGARCVTDLALLGRSKALALVLITQNNSHLDRLNIENTISTRFAFRSTRKEAESIIRHMELPDNEGFEENIINLETGECLMKDFLNRYDKVRISAWRTDWNEAFETNPLKKLKAAQQSKATK